MLRILDRTEFELPPTKTYKRRRGLWIPADTDCPEWDRRLGNMTLVLQHALGGWGKTDDVDSYAIVEEPLVGIMGRKFLLLNLTDPDQFDVYETIIGPELSCTCTAAKCRVPGYEGTEGCKHRDALGLLVESGIIDGEEPAAPDFDQPGDDAGRCGKWIEDEVLA